MRPRLEPWLIPLAALAATPAYATVYLSVEQAQAALCPGATLAAAPRTLTLAQVAAIQRRSGQRVLSPDLHAWKISTGGWFLVDQVIGKHEFITYAVAIDAAGAVTGIDILESRESYGGEVRRPAWRAQFVGKRADSQLKLGGDIKNISGATLSSKHITDGIKRLLVTHAVALADA